MNIAETYIFENGWQPSHRIWRAASLVLLAFAMCAGVAIADDEDSIESAQSGLREWGRYNWYDASTDDLREVKQDPPPPPAPPPSGGSLGIGFPDWLTLVGWTCVAILLVVLAVALIQFYRNRELRGQAQDQAGVPGDRLSAAQVEALPRPVRERSNDLRGEARRLYDAGRYAEAIVYLYAHELVTLDRAQFIRLAKGKTNRSYLREIGPNRELRDIFEPSLVSFEDAFFGKHDISRERFEACWSRLEEFESLCMQVAT